MRPTFLVIAAAAVTATVAVTYFGAGHRMDPSVDAPASAGIPALEALAARTPDNSEIWKRLAVAYRRGGRIEDATTAYVRAARISPDDAEIILALRDLAATADR
jgi:cytochrome c-type biogenesis protein CcmH/NrfG